MILLCVSSVVYSWQTDPANRRLIPYTIRELEKVSPGLENEYLRALRSDGTRVTKTLPTGKSASGNEAWKLDVPAEYKTVIVADAVGMVSTFYSPRNVPSNAGYTSAKPNCEGRLTGYTVVGEGTHLGYKVLHFSSRTKVGNDWNQESHWLAPAINCEDLRFQSTTVSLAGQVASTYQKEAVSIELGEPNAAYFLVPASFAEVAPSVANIALVE